GEGGILGHPRSRQTPGARAAPPDDAPLCPPLLSRHSPPPTPLRYSSKPIHDLNYFIDHLDLFAAMAKQRDIALDLEAFRSLDRERRELITENEKRKAQRNRASEEIARLKKEKKNADAILAQMKQL